MREAQKKVREKVKEGGRARETNGEMVRNEKKRNNWGKKKKTVSNRRGEKERERGVRRERKRKKERMMDWSNWR